MTGPRSDNATLANEIDRSLRDDLLRAWFPRSIDPHGGYIEYFGHAWRPMGDKRRSLIHQSRLAWTAASFSSYDSSFADEYATYALHGLRFIDSAFRDERSGGFFFDIDGEAKPLRNGEKHACATAYAMMAGARTFIATGERFARDVARDAATWLEQHCRRANGVYVEDLSRDGRPIHASESRSQRRLFGLIRKRPSRNPLGRPFGTTTMNTHIHLLEAYAELHRADPGGSTREPLENLIEIVRDRFVSPDGRLADRLGADGVTRESEATHGHAIETAALLLEAADSLGMPDDRVTGSIATSLASRGLAHARDPVYGGTFDAPAVDSGDKIWWVSGEALNTWTAMYRCATRTAGDVFLWRQAIDDEWAFIRNYLLDRKNRGWHKQTARDGTVRTKHPKSDAWIDPYHNARGLMNAVSALRNGGQ